MFLGKEKDSSQGDDTKLLRTRRIRSLYAPVSFHDKSRSFYVGVVAIKVSAVEVQMGEIVSLLTPRILMRPRTQGPADCKNFQPPASTVALINITAEYLACGLLSCKSAESWVLSLWTSTKDSAPSTVWTPFSDDRTLAQLEILAAKKGAMCGNCWEGVDEIRWVITRRGVEDWVAL